MELSQLLGDQTTTINKLTIACPVPDDYFDRTTQDCSPPAFSTCGKKNRQIFWIWRRRFVTAYGHLRPHSPLVGLHMVSGDWRRSDSLFSCAAGTPLAAPKTIRRSAGWRYWPTTLISFTVRTIQGGPVSKVDTWRRSTSRLRRWRASDLETSHPTRTPRRSSPSAWCWRDVSIGIGGSQERVNQ